jgi:AraC family transcriptional regulator
MRVRWTSSLTSFRYSDVGDLGMHRHVMYLDEEPEFGACYGFAPPGPVLEWLQSDRWFLLALIRHEGIAQVGGLTQLIRGDTALVIAPGTRVRIERTLDSAEMSHFWVHFRPSETGDFKVSLPWITEIGDLMKTLDPMLRRAFDAMPWTKRRLAVLAWNILWELSTNAAEVRLSSQMEVAQEFILKGLGENVTVSDIAAAAGVSHNHLIRMFQDEFGMAPSGYVRTQRITRACHLLLNTDESIKNIGAQVGYPSAQHFHRVMKSVLGIGPQEVRTSRRPLSIIQDFVVDQANRFD